MTKHKNKYDKHDLVSRDAYIKAGALKIARYRAREPETGEFSMSQYHMTIDNTVMAVMGEDAATLFCKFVEDCKKRDADND